MIEGRLVLSSNRGRYAIGDPDNGPDLSSNRHVEVKLGDRWIPGRIEYDHDAIYATLGPQVLEDVPKLKDAPRGIGGYYFNAETGETCGLCVGMEVRVL